MKWKHMLILIISTLFIESCVRWNRHNSFGRCIHCANRNYYAWNEFDYLSSSEQIDSFFISIGVINTGDRNNYLKLYRSEAIDSIDKSMFLGSFESGLMEMPHGWTNYFNCAAQNKDQKWEKFSALLHVDFEQLFNSRQEQIALLETIDDNQFANLDVKYFFQKLIYMDIVYRTE